jgi:hypothetical protein
MKKMRKTKYPVKLEGYNFRYLVDVEYDTEYHCDEEENCDEEGNSFCKNDFCRCSTIENTRIEKGIDILYIVQAVLSPKSSIIDEYCVERILRINKIYDTDPYHDMLDIEVCRGYYGEEIGSVTLDRQIAKKIDEEVAKMLSLSDNDKIRYVLELEYGYVLESLKNLTFSIKEVDKENIIFAQKEYAKKLDKEMVEQYKDWNDLPRGICLKEDNVEKYRIIDGYHRCMAATDKLKIFVGEKR